jgi:hypothetical protein
LKQRLVLWLAYLFALTFAFVACGGGGGSSGNGNPGNGGKTDDIYKQYPDLPPDPGSAGKATLEGIDSNKNGVRDDVEIAIYNYAPKPEQKELRQALAQMSKGLQASILAGSKNSVSESLKVQQETAKDVDCLIMKSPDMINSRQELIMMERLVANTDARAKAYINYNKALSGRFFSAKGDSIPCDSDREKEIKAQAAFNAKPFNVQSAYNLPPDPGEAGKATLEGIDANKNGVRDDVEIAIYNYAPRPDQERYRAAIMQYAKNKQERINVSSSNTRDDIARVHHESRKALECLDMVGFGGVVDEIRLVNRLVYNTAQRDSAGIKYGNAVAKYKLSPFASSGDPVPCDYDKAKR